MKSRRELIRFLATGTCGFLIDAGVMQCVSATLGVTVLAARCVSFPAATTVTWLLNRYWTFEHGRTRKASSQYLLHFCGQLVSLAINFGVFSGLLLSVEVMAIHPVVALAIGAIVALAFSFVFARMVAFKTLAQVSRADDDRP